MKSHGEREPIVASFPDSTLRRIRRGLGGAASNLMLREIDNATELYKSETHETAALRSTHPETWKPEWGYDGQDGLISHVRIRDMPLGEVIEMPLRDN